MKRYMQKLMLILLAGVVMTGFASLAEASVRVFACEPEWAALATEIGGNDVSIYTATHALQDPHHIQARPSLIARMRRADLLIATGAQLEIGWLPVLLRQSANPAVQPGQAGNLAAADYVQKLDVPTRVDRSQGDIHPGGNPHNAYQQRYNDFMTRWKQAMQGLYDALARIGGGRHAGTCTRRTANHIAPVHTAG